MERCLEGEEAAILELKELHNSYLKNVLFSYRAAEGEVDEVISNLWLDCLSATPPKLALLNRYNGKSALKSWLGAIAVNRWLSLKRRHSVHARVISELQTSNDCNADGEATSNPSVIDIEILRIIAAALQKSFSECSDEEVVLLHLIHLHHLTQREVSTLWKAHESQISRKLGVAEAKIQNATLKEIKSQDPHLEINWNDFVRLCESTNLLLK